ncbi:tetratricopeptide repeat protein [Chryseobacterium sp. SIMBA_029]|uniref:tetratricopeptide repeat protein n=1 Tax=Chryseobacterium sp. SIMBA_029 TaxID=3085772 RepID=UPI00397B1E44
MRNKIILLLFFILPFNDTFSQSSENIHSIDSLLTIVNSNNAFAEKGSKEMLRLCTEIYYQSKNIGYKEGQLRSIVKSSGIYMNEQNYGEALKRISEGIKLAEESNSFLNWTNLLRIQGRINSQLGYFQKARIIFKKALLIANKAPESDEKYATIAIIYYELGHINYNNESENSIKNDKIKYDSVIFYCYKAYEESKKISNVYPKKAGFIASYALALAQGYFYLNNIPKVEKYLNEFYILTEDEKYKGRSIPYYTLRGEIENRRKNYPKAIKYFTQGIKLYKEYKVLPSELMGCYSGIAEAYKGSNDYENQAIYLEKAQRMSDSLSLADKKIVEKVSVAEDKERQSPENNLIIIAVVIFVILIIAFLRYYFLSFKRGK